MVNSVVWRRAAPIVASGTVVTTLVTCLIIAKVNHVYTGGLAWPYFSDLGRDAPGYYIFCVGLSVVAVSLSATWWFNRQFQHGTLFGTLRHRQVPRHVGWAISTCVVLGIASTIGLPVLVRHTMRYDSSIEVRETDRGDVVCRPSSARHPTRRCTTTRPIGSSCSRPLPSS